MTVGAGDQQRVEDGRDAAADDGRQPGVGVDGRHLFVDLEDTERKGFGEAAEEIFAGTYRRHAIVGMLLEEVFEGRVKSRAGESGDGHATKGIGQRPARLSAFRRHRAGQLSPDPLPTQSRPNPDRYR